MACRLRERVAHTFQTMKTTPIIASLLFTLASAGSLCAQGAGMLGGLSEADFAKLNKDAAAQVAALKPSAKALSDDDKELLKMVAQGGMMQLEAGKLAVKNATTPDIKMIAQAEVEEQTGLAAKLKEIAAAKSATLPSAPDEKATKELAMLAEKSGKEFDAAYLKHSGVDGHKLLQSTMKKVESKADDADLKKLAETVLPLIKIHLQVAESEAKGG
jgi:putative membrane protein